jgi:hypothetical protein
MEVWTWIIAYIVGFSLLQLLVYRYFRDSEPSVEGPSPGSGERYASGDRLERDQSGRTATDDGVYCQHCGTYNEQTATYRYCKQCVAPIR